ncbi:MAG: HutD family protein [Actinobacteria bacterium]|nr:HutD family protein [Actinomycetota bacterium]
MSPQLIRVADVEPQMWRNGGGYTRELLAWPSIENWDLRISVADVEADGPFSVFEGVERWLVLIAGQGIALRLDGGERHLAPGDPPLRFDGASAPDCRLLAGATRDLNLMVRRGHGVMRPVQPGRPWDEQLAMRGVFTATPGRWTGDGESRSLPAMTLFWMEHSNVRDSAGWTFHRDGRADSHQAPTDAWWLGFTSDQSSQIDS